MTEVESRRRSQSLRSTQSTNDNQRRISLDSQSQRRVSIESTKSDRKYSQDNTSRKLSVSRRISGSSFFSNFKKPPEPKDNLHDKKNRFENTYRLEPKSRFPEGKVRAVITEALETLTSHNYSPTHSPFLAKLLSARVLESVKQLNIERYKVVCLVTIGSKESQGLRIASRCLWNDRFDTFVTACFESERFFAVGTVYGVYYE